MRIRLADIEPPRRPRRLRSYLPSRAAVVETACFAAVLVLVALVTLAIF